MKKTFLSACVISMTALCVNAQEATFDNLGKFEKIDVIFDTKSKKMRPATDIEIKTMMANEINKRLYEIGSVRRTEANRITVLPTLISVPILEMDGSFFNTVLIDRKTGLNNHDLVTYNKQEKIRREYSKWQEAVEGYEKRAKDNEKAMEEYRKKYPSSKEDKFSLTLPKNVYKPKAPARKINIKE